MRFPIALLAVALPTAACDRLAATVSAASVLTRTPDLANAEHMPAELYQVLSLGNLAIKPGTAAVVTVGERESPTSTVTPTPISGAAVLVGWVDQRVGLCEMDAAGGEGTYGTASFDGHECQRQLEYVEEETYLTEVETGTDLYTMAVTAPPAIAASSVQFTPALPAPSDRFGVTLPVHPGVALTLDWSGDPTVSDRRVFVTMGRVRYVDDGAGALSSGSWQTDTQLVWDNFPRTGGDMIALIAGEPATSATIDASAFDQTGLYVLVVTATELSNNVSTNLFLGSSALAGAGTAFVFWVD
jgi:hypothetical protein